MFVFRIRQYLLHVCVLAFCIAITGSWIQAQSLDARSPSPVRSNEVVGRIAARDIGDARLTDHFYTFVGTPGDLLITIDTRNLNGDIDVFTAGSLRPVLKLSIYAEANSAVTKSVYLRQREELILRIEARSPNDDDGIYHLRFGGSFEPVLGGAENTEETAAGESASNPPPRRGQKVSSVGARIKEPTPPPEVASAPTPEPSPAVEAPTPEVKTESPAEVKPARSARTRPAPRRTRSKATPAEEAAVKPSAESEAPKTVEEPTKTEPADKSSEEATTKAAPTRKNAKKSRTVTTEPVDVSAAPTDESAPAPKVRNSKRASTSTDEGTRQPEEAPSKLVIELLDGTRVERYMSSVRRVTVESGQIVVTRTDGTVERIRLASVIRMSIGP